MSFEINNRAPIGSLLKGEKKTFKKAKRAKKCEYTKYIQSLPSLYSLAFPPCEAAHIRFDDVQANKRFVGGAEKPDDFWMVPLSPEDHRKQHSMDERKFWDEQGIDPVKVAMALERLYPNVFEATQFINRIHKYLNRGEQS